FTSGSTGKPKGVQVEHRGIVRLVKNTSLLAGTDAAVPIAHLSNLAFDAATWELYAPLLNGGSVVCIDHMTVLDAAALERTFVQEGIKGAFLSTALFKQRIEEAPGTFSGLDILLAGGERMN